MHMLIYMHDIIICAILSQVLVGVAHDDIDPSVFSISGDKQNVSHPYIYIQNIFSGKLCNPLTLSCVFWTYINACIQAFFKLF